MQHPRWRTSLNPADGEREVLYGRFTRGSSCLATPGWMIYHRWGNWHRDGAGTRSRDGCATRGGQVCPGRFGENGRWRIENREASRSDAKAQRGASKIGDVVWWQGSGEVQPDTVLNFGKAGRSPALSPSWRSAFAKATADKRGRGRPERRITRRQLVSRGVPAVTNRRYRAAGAAGSGPTGRGLFFGMVPGGSPRALT